MSKSMRQEITCPACSKAGSFVIWQSINTQLDPEMKQAVRDGSAFLYSCPYCRDVTHVEYDLLYHQMEDRIMIHVAGDEQAVRKALEALNGDRLPDFMRDLIKSSYLIRIVKSHNFLREKLAILDNGLDDRIMEIYKVFLFSRYLETGPAADTVILHYFRAPDGEEGIQILGDGKPAGAFEFSGEFYDQLCARFMPLLKDIRDEEPVIDQRWALKFLHAHGEE